MNNTLALPFIKALYSKFLTDKLLK